MAKCPTHRERLATAEAAVAAAAAETPATSVALPPTTVPQTGIPSRVQTAAHRLLGGDADQVEALGESGNVGLVCFHSQNLLFSDSEPRTREQLFQCLPVHVGFDPYYRAGVEMGKKQTVAPMKVRVFRQPAMPIACEAVETGASGTSSVCMLRRTVWKVILSVRRARCN